MFLSRDNVVIRRARPSDAVLLANWWANGKIMAHAGFPNGIKTNIPELTKRIIDQNAVENPQNVLLIIEISGIPVGEMNYNIKDDGTAEIGIKICDVNYQNKGYGTISIKLLAGYLFDKKKIKKIVLDTNINNERAKHVYEKIGFIKTAINENAFIDQLGNWQTAVCYELSPNNLK